MENQDAATLRAEARNAALKTVLDRHRDELDEELAKAYEVRGLPAPRRRLSPEERAERNRQEKKLRAAERIRKIAEDADLDLSSDFRVEENRTDDSDTEHQE